MGGKGDRFKLKTTYSGTMIYLHLPQNLKLLENSEFNQYSNNR